MTIAHCPECQEQVRVPDNVSDEAQVRCPLCLADFALGDVLSNLPPQLIVLDSASAQTEPANAGTAAAGPAFAGIQTSEVAVSDAEGARAAPAFESQQPAAPALIRPTRPRRREKSAVKEIAKILIGGVVGLSIGQLILWWLPGQWRRDPFRLGPKVSLYAPMIVPRAFHDRSIAAQDEADEEQSVTAGLGAAGSPFGVDRPKGGGDEKASGITAKENTLAQDSPTESTDAATSLDPAGASINDPERVANDANSREPEPAADLIQIDLEDVSGSPLAESSEPESTDADQAPAPPNSQPSGLPEPSEPPGEPVAVRSAPEVTPQSLQQKLHTAQSASDAWDEALTPSPAEHRQLAADLYRALAGLGEALTYVNHHDQVVAESVQKVVGLLRNISRDEAKMSLVGKVAPSWMISKRPHNGVCLSGTAKSIDTRGQLYATEIKMGSGETIILVGTVDPSKHFAIGAQVLVLGTILEKPQENLDGYEGDESVVVLDGFHLGVSGEAPEGPTPDAS